MFLGTLYYPVGLQGQISSRACIFYAVWPLEACWAACQGYCQALGPSKCWEAHEVYACICLHRIAACCNHHSNKILHPRSLLLQTAGPALAKRCNCLTVRSCICRQSCAVILPSRQIYRRCLKQAIHDPVHMLIKLVLVCSALQALSEAAREWEALENFRSAAEARHVAALVSDATGDSAGRNKAAAASLQLSQQVQPWIMGQC